MRKCAGTWRPLSVSRRRGSGGTYSPIRTGVQYPHSRYSKVRNYVLEFLEMGWELDPIPRTFCRERRLSAGSVGLSHDRPDWPRTTAGSQAEQPQQQALPQAFDADPAVAAIEKATDTLPHTSRDPRPGQRGRRRGGNHPLPRYVGGDCRSQAAEMAAVRLWQRCPRRHKAIPSVTPVKQTLGADALDIGELDPCDLLVYVTPHAHKTLAQDLERFAQVRWIVLHDTQRSGTALDGGGQGCSAFQLRDFTERHPEWFVVSHATTHSGLTVIGCQERIADQPKPILLAPLKRDRHGDEGDAVGRVEVFAADQRHCDKCYQRSLQMDLWGVEGCKRNRDQIIAWIREKPTRMEMERQDRRR